MDPFKRYSKRRFDIGVFPTLSLEINHTVPVVQRKAGGEWGRVDVYLLLFSLLSSQALLTGVL